MFVMVRTDLKGRIELGVEGLGVTRPGEKVRVRSARDANTSSPSTPSSILPFRSVLKGAEIDQKLE
jgi:hypothetical protein